MDLSGVEFAWLRPYWLLALALLPAIWWSWRQRHGRHSVWQRAIDPHLLPHLLQHIEVRAGSGASVISLLAATLAILALAGPSLRQEPAQLWQIESPLVVALDLSAAMRATDLPPSRVVQVRAKLQQLLQQRRSGQIGLLVYAGDAFTVAPITRDARTVGALLESLTPDIMPVQGQRADRAIEHGLEMLRDNGSSGGEILLISDRVDANAERAAARARQAGVTVSVLGVGTLAGAPLTGASGFITGSDGKPMLARLDAASLGALAAAGGGRYAPLASDNADLVALALLDPTGKAATATRPESGTGGGVTRSDDGYWLLLLVLPLMLAGFRRGWLSLLPLVLAMGMAVPSAPAFAVGGPRACAAASGGASDRTAAPQARRPPTATAVPGASRACAAADDAEARPPQTTSGWSWDALWRRADQRAFAALQDGEHERARALAPDPALAGAAAYRGDDFEAAASAWSSADSADADYNRGNALARAGKLQDALRAYDEALASEPGMADAVANRKAVEDFLKQQQAQKQQGEQGEQGQQDQQAGQGEQGQQDPQSKDAGDGEERQEGEEGEEGREGQQGEQDAQQQPGESQPAGERGEPQDSGKPESQSPANPQQEGGDSEPQSQDGEADGAPSDAAESAQAREAAEAAAREAMQKALDAGQGKEEAAEARAAPMTPEQRAQAEQSQATEQLLRRVPDDPGALLRRKFELEYRRRQAEGERQ